ncbi:DUF3616 domain-containing protein [Modestobacter sp. I12A-02628]|uniref:DUF3616 domain-containing protein n=1 Tax=Goekera deserti TaxID=2497753 RepID=A0A7K3WDZ7_9ACTN|nr:DUF3616 domain-containing protein [Goekera deserti]MPQ98560.1 DUF3616 domain-containing protein [Goekera deserti]NDI49070.1 DUF3616 domain-containing protein [Goekera deserti]NEL54139.1 DUF3616 domain-containing protein [Goekera deserti]
MITPAPVVRQVALHFTEGSRAAATHVNLSAVRQDGPHLWVAGDETATLERLTVRTTDGVATGWSDQHSVRLADLVELPAADDEVDVEGIARQGPWLWAVGSHSLKRKRLRAGDDDAKARRRLAKVVREPNRFVLMRLPVDPATGLPARRVAGPDGVLTAAVLGGRGDALTDEMARDPLLAPFLSIPSKDNGVDVEGIAVHGDRLYVGFRGPVLRGWAVVAEVWPETSPGDPHRLRLRELPEGGRYRLHLLDLDGLGVRDLCPDGPDLLVLAGPSMSLSGPVRVHRWLDGCATDAPAVVRREQLPAVLQLAHGEGQDHAEGIAVLDETGPDGARRLLVVHDSPAADRHAEAGALLADVVDLPDR